jgi:PRC-barrel domain
VEGTTVYDPQGNNIGSIKRLMIEKISGRVAYAVMSFGGFLGMGEEESIPWGKLTYDTRTDVTESQLRGAPAFSRDRNWDWSDRSREQELHDYYCASRLTVLSQPSSVSFFLCEPGAGAARNLFRRDKA